MTPNIIAIYVSLAVCALLLCFGLAVLYKIVTGKIDLTYLLSETTRDPGAPANAPPKASLSRFQFLIFTFVVAALYLVLCIEAGTLIDVPNGTLALLGISGGGYLVSKGLGSKAPAHSPPAPPAPPAPPQ
ncbi:MAG: hypothetical protein JJ959_19555 [Nisaea sp.]|uniref:hypothetical protein n=1 Tax=Nisaea sp. TaxID=2024842 RepID=UPI001AFF26CB|nr:hypothetical protein [Nisaea sp.]MBO6562754.1 hypothetical protein [Nisaea sp.]